MKLMPPCWASAIARRGPETACMIADTIGMLSVIEGSSPRLKRTSGVFRETLSGMHSDDE
jgi:hypothetical protein